MDLQKIWDKVRSNFHLIKSTVKHDTLKFLTVFQALGEGV